MQFARRDFGQNRIPVMTVISSIAVMRKDRRARP